MKNILWIAAVILAFFAGYFTHGTREETSTSAEHAETTQKNNQIAEPIVSEPKMSSEQLSAAAKAVFATKEKTSSVAPQNQLTPEQQAANAAKKQAVLDALQNDDSTAKKYPNEISDEDIDKILPAPFNKSLKNNHGDIREKYKDFAQANTPSDWDINMQHKLTDFILSRTYAKFINLDSVLCKANLCEIRLYENKKGAWGFILSEMALQDWWDIGNYGSSGMSPEKDDKRGMSYLVLLVRK
jgi:hypothetical protein